MTYIKLSFPFGLIFEFIVYIIRVLHKYKAVAVSNTSCRFLGSLEMFSFEFPKRVVLTLGCTYILLNVEITSFS